MSSSFSIVIAIHTSISSHSWRHSSISLHRFQSGTVLKTNKQTNKQKNKPRSISYLLKITAIYFYLHFFNHCWNIFFFLCLLGTHFFPFLVYLWTLIFFLSIGIFVILSHWSERFYISSLLSLEPCQWTWAWRELRTVHKLHGQISQLYNGWWDEKVGFCEPQLGVCLQSQGRIFVKVGLAGSCLKKLKFGVMYYFNLHALYSLHTWDLFGRGLILLAAESRKVASNSTEN